MTNRKQMIVCSPSDMPAHVPSVEVEADCGHKVWMSAATAAMTIQADAPFTTTCIRCVDVKEFAAAVAKDELREIPGQRDEIASVLGEERTDEALRRFKPLGEP